MLDEQVIQRTLEFLAKAGWRNSDENFFEALVRYLYETLGVTYAFVDQIVPGDSGKLQTLALVAHGKVEQNFEYDLSGTPCEEVLGRQLRCYVSGVQSRFPNDSMLSEMQAESYAGVPLWGEDGSPIGLIAVIDTQPIRHPELVEAVLQTIELRASAEVERRRLAILLEQSHRRFKDFAEISSDWFWEADDQYRYTWFSDNVSEFVGVPPEWHYGKTRFDLLSPYMDDEQVKAHFQALQRREPYTDFLVHRRSPNGDHWIRSSGRPIFDDDGIFRGYRGTGRDVTAVIEARLAAEREQERFQLAVENSSDGMAMFDPSGRLVLCNAMFRTMNPELAPVIRLGMTFEDMVRDNIRHGRILEAVGREEEFLRERLARHREGGEPLLSQRRDGRWLLLREVRTSDGGVILINTDLTEIKNAEERDHHAQRMQAIGQITGGVAHDFNNMLATMLGSSEMLALEVEGNPNAERFVRILEQSVQRGAALTDRLLSFSSQQVLKPAPTQLDDRIAGLSDVLKSALGAQTEIDVRSDADLWPALVDPLQFENAVLNVVINARDAMPDGGRLTVLLENVRLTAENAPENGMVELGDYVRLTISDTGNGIDPVIIDRVFDPFFTTKDIGEGSGLGLSMVYGFARQSGGFVEITNREVKGASVLICLPRAEREAPPPTETRPTVVPEGQERILLVEDDAAVRSLTLAALRSAGYAVIEAENGAEAIEMFKSDAPFDMVVTDVGLQGGMSGYDVARAVGGLQPSIKILLVSGYPDKDLPQDDFGEAVELLRKPFRRAELLNKVRMILDRTIAPSNR